jgi:hypothetical protein
MRPLSADTLTSTQQQIVELRTKWGYDRVQVCTTLCLLDEEYHNAMEVIESKWRDWDYDDE